MIFARSNRPAACVWERTRGGLYCAPASLTWLLLTLVVRAASLAFLVWQLNLRGLAAPAFLALALLYQPLYANILHAQVYIFLLGLMVLAWHGHRRGRPRRIGIPLGLVLGLKTDGGRPWLL